MKIVCKEFRKEKKMSQLGLAKSIGVSRQTINMVKAANTTPPSSSVSIWLEERWIPRHSTPSFGI